MSPGKRLRFGEFEVDMVNHVLRKNGAVVRLSRQPLSVLMLLASRPEQLVTREELRRATWGEGTTVDFEHGLNTCIRQIRAALGEQAGTAQIVETVPRL